jgi:hypothetical protein
MLSPAASLALALNEAHTTYTHAQYAMLLSEISCCCRRNVTSAGWWVIVYDVKHTLLVPNTLPSTATKCMRHESACFSQITMQPFKHMSVWWSLQSGYRCCYSLSAATEFPSQKPYTRCMSAYCALVHLGIFIFATILVTGTTVRVR